MGNMSVWILIICVSRAVTGQLIGIGENVNNDNKNGICGTVYDGTRTRLTIAVPTVNGTYSPNLLCRWEAQTAEEDTWLVTSTYFSVEQSLDCRWDYLRIRDGSDDDDHEIGRFCGYKALSFLSSTNTLFFYFKSDGSLHEKGFELEMTSIKRDSWNDSQCNRQVEQEGVVTSPNYPDIYPADSLCLYWIKAPNENYRVHLDILDISIEDTSCVFDHVSVYDGSDSHSEKIIDLCGNKIPMEDITSTGENMLIKFVTDSFGHDGGFQFYVKFLESSTSDKLHGKFDCDRVIDGDINGIITSPGFPVSYPSNVHCTTIIHAPADGHIRLTVTFLELEGSANCSYDYLEIFSENLSGSKTLDKMCGHTSEGIEFVSEYNTLRLEFRSDDYVSWRGFSANYTVIPNQGCLPYCANTHVCINVLDVHRCLEGRRCDVNICETGDCIQNGGNVTCLCPVNFTGTLCNQRVSSPSQQQGAGNFETGISLMPLSVAFQKGNPAMIHCRVNLTDASYTWAQDDSLVLSDIGVIEHLNGSLEILNFDVKYVGVYKCLASTAEAFMQTVINVTMLQGCDVEFEQSDVSVHVGEELCLTCGLDDALNITWYFQEKEIKPDLNTIISDNDSRLCVRSVGADGTGIYTCSVRRRNECITSRTVLVTVSRPQSDTAMCGRPAIPEMLPRFLGRISRGRTVNHGSNPWHVILRDRRERSTFCGGTLISHFWMVTAAHCTSNDHFSREFNKSFEANTIDLYLGTDFCNGTNGQKRGIRRYIPYPNFGQRAPYDNDIALIEFDRPVDYTNDIRPICLESLENVENIFMNRRFGRSIGRVIGCGRIHERITEIPQYLRDVFVPYVERRLCSNARIGSGNFTESMFCAGYNRAYMGDACAGDSGGSLTMQRNENDPWFLIGIVSWGVGCDRPGQYGYYTHVAKFLEWIKSVTGIQ